MQKELTFEQAMMGMIAQIRREFLATSQKDLRSPTRFYSPTTGENGEDPAGVILTIPHGVDFRFQRNVLERLADRQAVRILKEKNTRMGSDFIIEINAQRFDEIEKGLHRKNRALGKNERQNNQPLKKISVRAVDFSEEKSILSVDGIDIKIPRGRLGHAFCTFLCSPQVATGAAISWDEIYTAMTGEEVGSATEERRHAKRKVYDALRRVNEVVHAYIKPSPPIFTWQAKGVVREYSMR